MFIIVNFSNSLELEILGEWRDLLEEDAGEGAVGVNGVGR
jgi:hypothetical protein